jgi:serine/threonine protein kinase/Flp pilus assembly protein TadD
MTTEGGGSLTPRQLQRLDEALKQVLELPEHDRQGWVDSSFPDAPALREALADMLSSDTASAAFFDAASAQRDEVASQLMEDRAKGTQAGQLIGSMIGQYRLESLIASGGMGAVYRATRADGEFDQTVAIKILPGWATDPVTVSRLKMERQILSSLQHPGITPLLDGGQTGDGFPYLVTEFIDGVPITEHAREAGLSVTDNLNLFIAVADAVHYAHEQGVIHRDIKPSNILVDSAGHPHLLDFGIAKLEEGVLDTYTRPRTATGFIPMTPEYGSPEQRTGSEVGAASDIYQLGLLLYQLMTGERPVLRGDQETSVVTRPSTRVREQASEQAKASRSDLMHRARAIEGDLDTIVMKAMRPEPGDRYATAAAMTADLRHHLAGEPIEARPEPVRARLSRGVKRNPLGAVLGLILVGVLVAWAISSIQRSTPTTVASPAGPSPSIQEAQRFYERGRALLDQRSADAMPRAILNFEKAIDLDPNYAVAWAGLADSLALMASYAYESDPERLERARRATQKALELDPGSAEAWTARGTLEYLERHGTAALEAFEQAIRLQPDYAHAHTLAAYQLSVLGRFEESYVRARQGVDLDPLSPEALINLSASSMFTGRTEAALKAAQDARALSPGWSSTDFAVGQVMYHTGEYEAALSLLKDLSVPWTGAGAEVMVALSLFALGREEQAFAMVPTLEASGDTYALAAFYAATGDRDRGYELLQEIDSWADYPSLSFRSVDRKLWDPDNDDPRYQEIVRAIDAGWGVTSTRTGQ